MAACSSASNKRSVSADVETQKSEITELMKKELVKGDTWYLVDSRWWRKWMKFVGDQESDQFGVGEELNDPGPIDISSLFKTDGCTLKDHLLDELDYNLLPEEAWFKFVSWYGVTSDHQTIPRKVVERGLYTKSLHVEVYLLELRLGWRSDPETLVTRQFSGGDTIGHIMSEMRKIFSTPNEVETRVWIKYMNSTYGILSNMGFTAMDASIFDGQILLIEQKNEDGTWGKPLSPHSSSLTSGNGKKTPASIQKNPNRKPEVKSRLRSTVGLFAKKPPCRETKDETRGSESPIANRVANQQEGSLKNAHGKNAQVSAAVSKASASHVRSMNSAQLPSAKRDSKELEQDSNVNIRWREVQCDVIQMRQAVNEEERVLNNRKKELCEKETVLVNMLQNTVCEEQQARTRVENELHQARIAFNELNERLQHELVELRQALDCEVRLRDTRARQLKEKERISDQLWNTLKEEQQMRTLLEENLKSELLSSQARQQELERNENANREQQRRLEEERQQKTALEERLRNLEDQMLEERNRNLSNERELQSAVSAAQEELAEYQRRQPQDWIIQREEVLLSDNVLGKGAWGSVHQGTFRGCQVAVKEIHELILSPHYRRLFEREMSIASCCRHPNLLQFIGATNDDGSPLFVTEILDTSLRHLLSQRALSDEEIVSLALDVAKGLNYLHLNRPLAIIHRDISSANVLLWRRDEDWRAKLSDYGSANFMRHRMTVNPGAMIYSAPEAFTSQQSPKLDVYSFGVLLCEMCIRELPDPDPQGIHNQIRQVTNSTLQKLIKRCVKINPEERPTISEVISQLEGHSRSKGILTRMRTLLKVKTP